MKARGKYAKPIEHKKVILAIMYLFLAFLVLSGTLYAMFSDRAFAGANLQAGTLLVQLEEDPPFDGEVPEEGADTLLKVFRARSLSTVPMYVRARIIPIVEAFDEEENMYVTINIDVNDVLLSISGTDWVVDGGFIYFTQILEPEQVSEDVEVILTGIRDTNNYSNMNIRVTVRVELEAAQVQNDLWKEIFDIQAIPN